MIHGPYNVMLSSHISANYTLSHGKNSVIFLNYRVYKRSVFALPVSPV